MCLFLKHLSVDFLLPNIFFILIISTLMLQIIEKLNKHSHIYLVYNSLVF